ncbi:peroxisomal multifunctional beta-oxidation [Fusarium albosuccineum]|uniref:Peroxisomal hydratase-dehydrogenase-epimerase n=1 Tax=Fusarium albosuccineum TaxID=1237068 RepID=A0A8H4LE91_9HYPO|nr:peroxisomal multifunctional beta-oxidation [Fusarium albosuccineum]
MTLRYDDQVVVVTGAGSGLGKAYAKFFASRGASVVVNDLGASLKGQGNSTRAADEVVREIIDEGGRAVANYDSVEQGDRIIDTALNEFGRVDVLINNAGILRDVSFKNMTDQEWDAIYSVHVRGAYKTTRAAWPHFRKQKYGRVILTSSAAGIYGNFGQCNYSAAKSAMIGFGESLAKEGIKYNIRTNIIAPVAASRMTATVMPPDLLEHLTPDWVVPLVAVLAHPKNDFENGSIFEVGGGHLSRLRWERAKGALLKCDDTLSPGAVLAAWAGVEDFSTPEHPSTASDMVTKLKEAQLQPPNHPGQEIRFDGRVAVVTGGGAGLGRAYCLLLAKLGASVLVNDLVNPEKVAQEIRDLGGVAVPYASSVEAGDQVIKAAIDHFGRVDILINNAGILRDKSFQNMTDKMWDDINNVHMRGTYKCTKAAYPYMIQQKYGRIINTASTSGIYGNYGQTNYAAAKTAIIGFSRALAIEGRKYNIKVNCIAPSAGTQLTQGVLSEEVVRTRKPDYVAPFVVLLSSDKAPPTATGQLFEVGCGWQGRIRWQRSDGVDFTLNEKLTPEKVLESWKEITSFTPGKASYPEATADSRGRIIRNIERASATSQQSTGTDGYLAAIARAKTAKGEESTISFTDKDVILYNLSLGATATQMPLVFEQNEDFHVLPTFGVIPGTTASRPFKLEDLVPNFSFKRLLHGEHFLEIRKYPIPTSGALVSQTSLVDVLDKGKASIAIIGTVTKDAATGEDVFYNEFSLFLRGAGGFGGPATRAVGSDASAVYHMPDRSPDRVVEEKTSKDQAALYRLNGDRNPLHIDSVASQAGGFETPILHGLCTFGISAKHVTTTFGPIKNIKTRFTGVVVSGQTLATEMWKNGKVVRFQTRVKETGKVCIAGGGAVLLDTYEAHL